MVHQVLVILLSVLLLGDDLSGLSALGCVLSMVGSAWYGYVSLSGRQAEALLEAREACGQGQVKEPWGLGVLGGPTSSDFISA